jgi:hypothetical protein
LTLTTAERDLFNATGFVLSDRIAFEDFVHAYAYIYWKDLPVIVTADSILHAVHLPYQKLLGRVEVAILADRLEQLLRRTREQLQASAAGNQDQSLTPLYRDVDTYLQVAITLFGGQPPAEGDTSDAARYVRAAQSAAGIEPVALFGGEPRPIDFTLFTPRGHYTESFFLERYFQTMTWLGQIDFRILVADRAGRLHLQASHLEAAGLLLRAIDGSGQRGTWREFDTLLSALVGPADSTTLIDLDQLLTDVQAAKPGDIVHNRDLPRIERLIAAGSYGRQRIGGQILQRTLSPEPAPLPLSFMLVGQRFILDSYVMSELVYDRLIVNGQKVERQMPSPLDVMYVLGAERALTHLQPELRRWGYEGNLQALRRMVGQGNEYLGSDSIHGRWLAVLQSLNTITTPDAYPRAMRTAAWADKLLHTQLASWTQLRHDHILYAKQSTTVPIICSYPAGYVEPYPAFYAAVARYAEAGRRTFEQISATSLTDEGREIQRTAADYFANLAQVAGRLGQLAEKELRHEPFNEQDEQFVKSVTIRQSISVTGGCGPPVIQEEFDGWYPSLFPWGYDSPATIADVHTDPSDDGGILYVGVGPAAGMVIAVDSPDGACAYVGPAFTYYEFEEPGIETRLTDDAWADRLMSDKRPAPPTWTSSFRVSVATPPPLQQLPTQTPVPR